MPPLLYWTPLLNVLKEFDAGQKGISPDAEQYLASALPTIGWVQRTCGHWSHGLFVSTHLVLDEVVMISSAVGGDGLLDRVGQLAHEETWPIWPEETV